MSVDVTPVDEVDSGQPAERFEYGHRVSRAEDHHDTLGERESQVGDLVLDHVDPRDPGRRRRELVQADGQLAEAAEPGPGQVGTAEPHVTGLTAEAVAGGETDGRRVDAVRVKLEVE